ncbi:MAG TPA: hypothetical protein VGM39_03290 [Kofleriaceae bacterium]|jgi:hypothetical protein
MSVTETVFIARTKLPTRDAWQRALVHHGFSLVLDPELDTATHDGYVPCKLADDAAGFEYIVQDLEAYIVEQDCPERRAQIGGRDTAVSFVTRSSFKDLQAAMAAAAVLAASFDGIMWSDEAGDFYRDAPELLSMARGLANEEPPQTKREVAGPEMIATSLVARCVFKGSALTTLQTTEATPQRFTIKIPVTEAEVQIIGLWKHAVGNPTVHRVRVGATVHELDPKGVPLATA